MSLASEIKKNRRNLLRRVKLKFAIELKRPDTYPGLPDADAEAMYGIKFSPSNNIDEACPNDETTRLPDSNNIRSPSIIPCALCSLCMGAMASWVTALVPSKSEPCVIQTRPFRYCSDRAGEVCTIAQGTPTCIAKCKLQDVVRS